MTIRYLIDDVPGMNPYPDNLQVETNYEPQVSGREGKVVEFKRLDPDIVVFIEAEDIQSNTTTTSTTTEQPVDPETGIAPPPVVTTTTETTTTASWIPVNITAVSSNNSGITTSFASNSFTVSGKFDDVFSMDYSYVSNNSSATDPDKTFKETVSTAPGVPTSIASGYKLITETVKKIADIPTGFHHMQKLAQEAAGMKPQYVDVTFTSNASTLVGNSTQTVQYEIHVWKDWDKSRDQLKDLVKQGRS